MGAPLVLAGLATVSFTVSAQIAALEAPHCAALFQLQPTRAQVQGANAQDAYGLWWFEPNQATAASAITLALTPADSERFLGAKNDSVLMRWHSAQPEALSWAQRQSYLLVRAGEPIRDLQGQTIGRFVRLIGKARWDPRWLVEPRAHEPAQNSEFMIPLRIEQAAVEVQAGDQIIPRLCLQTEPPQSAPVTLQGSPTTQAHLMGLMNGHAGLMGVHNSVGIIDQGAAHGVSPEQSWVLAEVATTHDAPVQIARARAEVRILQVLPQYSLVLIQNADREALRGATLKRLSKDAPAREANAP